MVAHALYEEKEAGTERAALMEQIGDLMVDMREWPTWACKLALQQHLNFKERCSFIWFMLGNGCPPDFVARWCLAKPGYLRDFSARKHVAGLITSHGRGEFDGSSGASIREVWHLDKRQKVPCWTPTFAFDQVGTVAYLPKVTFGDKADDPMEVKAGYEHVGLPPGCVYWTQAAARLLNAN